MDHISGNNEIRRNEPTIPRFDYSVAFVFIALLLMVAFVLITHINITAWKFSSYQ